jgi:hypothetical protein
MFNLHVSFMHALVAAYSQRCLSNRSRGHVESFSDDSMRLGVDVDFQFMSDSTFNSDAYSTKHFRIRSDCFCSGFMRLQFSGFESSCACVLTERCRS